MLSRMKVQREVFLSSCLQLSDPYIFNFGKRKLHMIQAFTQQRILPVDRVHEKAGYTQMDIAR